MLEQGLPEFPPSILAREDSEECISISPYFYVCDLKDAGQQRVMCSADVEQLS